MKPVFGFLKPYMDAHTLGLYQLSDDLNELGYKTFVANEEICVNLDNVSHTSDISKIIFWIRANSITHLGISYRLDPNIAQEIFGRLYYLLRERRIMSEYGGPIKKIFFAGLPRACDLITNDHGNSIPVFSGAESHEDVLRMIGVTDRLIPKVVPESEEYERSRYDFARNLLSRNIHSDYRNESKYSYASYGTKHDGIVERLRNHAECSELPLLRAHVGPYDSNSEAALETFHGWIQQLVKSKALDILSIGTSQLTQSNFGERWGDKLNGGGIPINSEHQFEKIWELSRPMLVRSYSGTSNILEMARILDKTINNSWHALSLWWFSQLDGRGENDLLTNLQHHVEVLKYLALGRKPFEPNLSHHFAFRGSDDSTYLLSAYLAIKLAKKTGIKTLILQNMLNTPKKTSGLRDLAKSRALLKLARSESNSNFRVIFQPRAGLDYFVQDMSEARIQLAAVTALMDDIEIRNKRSPEIVHVVGFSEANYLANPKVIIESSQITLASISEYRKARLKGTIMDCSDVPIVNDWATELVEEVMELEKCINLMIKNPYSPNGLFEIFRMGFLPVPQLWGNRHLFPNAVNWRVKHSNGSTELVTEEGNRMSTAARIERIKELNWRSV